MIATHTLCSLPIFPFATLPAGYEPQASGSSHPVPGSEDADRLYAHVQLMCGSPAEARRRDCGQGVWAEDAWQG